MKNKGNMPQGAKDKVQRRCLSMFCLPDNFCPSHKVLLTLMSEVAAIMNARSVIQSLQRPSITNHAHTCNDTHPDGWSPTFSMEFHTKELSSHSVETSSSSRQQVLDMLAPRIPPNSAKPSKMD